jgi:hypothetical protein
VEQRGEEGRNKQLTFRRHASSNFNIGFFDDHAFFQRNTTSTSIFCSQDPFTIGIGQSRDWDYANTSVVITAVPGTEAHAPSSLYLLC